MNPKITAELLQSSVGRHGLLEILRITTQTQWGRLPGDCSRTTHHQVRYASSGKTLFTGSQFQCEAYAAGLSRALETVDTLRDAIADTLAFGLTEVSKQKLYAALNADLFYVPPTTDELEASASASELKAGTR